MSFWMSLNDWLSDFCFFVQYFYVFFIFYAKARSIKAKRGIFFCIYRLDCPRHLTSFCRLLCEVKPSPLIPNWHFKSKYVRRYRKLQVLPLLAPLWTLNVRPWKILVNKRPPPSSAGWSRSWLTFCYCWWQALRLMCNLCIFMMFVSHDRHICDTCCIVITGRPPRSAAMPVLFVLNGPKWVFGPAGATVAPINVKFGTGERTVRPHF